MNHAKASSGMGVRRLLILVGLISLIGFSLLHLNLKHLEVPLKHSPSSQNTRTPESPPQHKENPQIPLPSKPSKPSTTPAHTEEKLTPLNQITHPIAGLVNNATTHFEGVLSRQSKTLEEAVREYRRRYKQPPPPNFDVWYKFAKDRGVQMIDEYDTIYHSLLPFWAIPPNIIRARAREAIGFDNELIGLLIRNGKVTKVDGGGETKLWARDGLKGMLKPFVQYLPDMDLAFNKHDEPRVVVPHEDLHQLVTLATNTTFANGLSNSSPRNSWSQRPSDVNKGDRIDEFRTTRFTEFAHQATWTHSRASCPPESPARNLNDDTTDNAAAYTLGPLGFINNYTAFSDICLTPSLQHTFGFFDRSNAVNLVHDLFPIFSQSKISTYQDIPYPSPWYWDGKVTYEADKDFDWDSKKDQMYWRGSTTGGFSRAGGWRRQHRQRFVKNINGLDKTHVLEKNNKGTWDMREVSRPKYKQSFDVHFSHVGQCDPADCNAQMEYFDVVEPAGQQEAWAHKYLADVDGNAFSGRYYAFLLSNSLVYKMAIFREWHNEWIQPWVHFIPLSLKGDEHVEAVRYMAAEEEGKTLAKQIAKKGQNWAQKTLRNEDLEVWFFRLLLEYGRLVDDDRDSIGFGST